MKGGGGESLFSTIREIAKLVELTKFQTYGANIRKLNFFEVRKDLKTFRNRK